MPVKIPPIYLPQTNYIIATTEEVLEKAERLTPMAFVATVTTDTINPIMLDSRDNETKERSAEMIDSAAADIDVDNLFTGMEACVLAKKVSASS